MTPPNLPTLVPDFVSIGMPLVQRGFRIVPVHPLTKQGVMKNWQNFQITTPEQVLAFAKYYPHHNVAVVGKRKAGRHCFLDDDSGVAKHIEDETGHTMPKTYTVASRPDTNPLKKHFYFLQTDYSFKQFAVFADGCDPWKSKNVNRRDTTRFELSRTGLRIHPTIYDLKGIGGGSFVVAAGSLRESGERYTCIDDSSVAEIPNWLVDWLVWDIQKYREERVKAKKAKHARNGHSGYKDSRKNRCDISEEDVYDFIRWRAGQLTVLGFVGDGLEQALHYSVKANCEKGDVFIQSEHGKGLIHEIVEAAEGWETGTASPFYLTSETTSRTLEGHIMIYRTSSKQDVIEEIIKLFPDKISATEAIEKIEEGLFKDGYTFDRHAERSTVYRARKTMGFTVEGHSYWVRVGTEVKDGIKSENRGMHVCR
jgi:hypothetical protein